MSIKDKQIIADKMKQYEDIDEAVYYLLECPNCLAEVVANTLIQVTCPDCQYTIKIEEATVLDCCTQEELDYYNAIEDLKKGRHVIH